jgi:hypothetical protein
MRYSQKAFKQKSAPQQTAEDRLIADPLRLLSGLPIKRKSGKAVRPPKTPADLTAAINV